MSSDVYFVIGCRRMKKRWKTICFCTICSVMSANVRESQHKANRQCTTQLQQYFKVIFTHIFAFSAFYQRNRSSKLDSEFKWQRRSWWFKVWGSFTLVRCSKYKCMCKIPDDHFKENALARYFFDHRSQTISLCKKRNNYPYQIHGTTLFYYCWCPQLAASLTAFVKLLFDNKRDNLFQESLVWYCHKLIRSL